MPDRGLTESAAEYLPESRWQRCMVHFYRNVFSHVPATKVREVSHMLKAIAQENRDAADRKARAIVDDLRTARMNTAADLVERSVSETLNYYAFPDIHWQKIRTNNPLERIMREIRRRTRVVGAFPDGQSCLNLAAARLRYIAGTAWSTKCYMNMRPLYHPQIMQTEAVAPAHRFHLHLRRGLPTRGQGRRPDPAGLQHQGHEPALGGNRQSCRAQRPRRPLGRSGRLAPVDPSCRAGKHHHHSAAAEMPRAQPGRKRLAVPPRQLALQPHLQILR